MGTRSLPLSSLPLSSLLGLTLRKPFPARPQSLEVSADLSAPCVPPFEHDRKTDALVPSHLGQSGPYVNDRFLGGLHEISNAVRGCNPSKAAN